MLKKAYKVVRVLKNKSKISCWISIYNPRNTAGIVVYQQNRWTYPKEDCGPLCVFSGKRPAVSYRYRENLHKCEIWECLVEVVPQETENGFTAAIWRTNTEFNYVTRLPWALLPEKTVLASKVKLIRKVA